MNLAIKLFSTLVIGCIALQSLAVDDSKPEGVFSHELLRFKSSDEAGRCDIEAQQLRERVAVLEARIASLEKQSVFRLVPAESDQLVGQR